MTTYNIYIQLTTALSGQVASFKAFLRQVQLIGKNNIYVAGGVVRDAFLNDYFYAKDLDIFLSSEAFALIHNYLEMNGNLQLNQFGTYRWYANCDNGFYYDIIVIPQFYNGLWRCRNITDALNQFDFTINAMAFDLFDGTFFDPQNGLLDIESRVLKAIRFDFPDINVSNQISMSRNTVLWFRYCHYAKKLSITIDELTRLWIQDNLFRKDSIDEFTFHFFPPLLY